MKGVHLRNLRKNKGLSLRAFGEQMGVSGEWIRLLEAYDYISPEIKERICTTFNVDSADPLFFTTPNAPQLQRESGKIRAAAERAALKPVRANYLRNLRKELRISQKELAAAIGVKQQTISSYESEKTLISDEMMEQFEKAIPAIHLQQAQKTHTRRGGRQAVEPFITVCRPGLRFSKAMTDKLGNSGRVKVYYREPDRLMVIMAAKEDEKGAQRLNTKTKLNNAGVRKMAEKLLGFKVGNGYYRVKGIWTEDEGDEFWRFDMSKWSETTRNAG